MYFLIKFMFYWQNNNMEYCEVIILKRFFYYICIFFLLIGFCSCSGKNEKKQLGGERGKEFEVKVATNIVESYMKSIMKGNTEGSKKFLSKEMIKKEVIFKEGNLKIRGYLITDISQVGNSGIFKLKVVRSSINSPSSSLDEYTIKIEKEKEEEDYKISKIDNVTDKEVFLEGKQLRIRSKSNIKTDLLLERDGIPEYAFAADDKAKLNKEVVPKDSFTNSIINYDGGEVAAATTNGKDIYIFLAKIDESMAVQGESQSQTGGGAGGGAGEGTNKIKGGPKEIPIGKEHTSLDILKDTKVDFICYSNEQKHIVVQYTKGKDSFIRIYEGESGEMIPVDLEKEYPLDKVDVKFSSFDEDVLNFEVIPKENIKDAPQNLIGKWQISLKNYKMKRI